MTYQRILLALSLAANLALAVTLYSYADAYADLAHWACEHGNGGHECGEE